MSREDDYLLIPAMAGLEREECPLRPQELEAVQRTANGENTKQIAYTMGITLNQIYWLLRSAKNATGAKRETDLVAKCIRNGWIE